MRVISHPILSILLCFSLLLGVQSHSDITFHAIERPNTERSPSHHTRFLQQMIPGSCYSTTCVASSSSLEDEGTYVTYSLSIYGGSEILFDIKVGKDKMAFALELDSSPTITTRTNIKINPSDTWPNNAVPAVTGVSWTGNLNIPSSSSSARAIRIGIRNQASYITTRVTFKMTVTSAESSGLQGWAIIIIVVGVVAVAVAVTTCVCVRVKRRRLAKERAARIQAASQSTTSYSQQQPQQTYNQDLQPIQQPQMYMQPQQMYDQQAQMYPQQMYVQQPQMYPQQQMYMQQPMYQQYPQQQMYQQQPMVIQVGQPQ